MRLAIVGIVFLGATGFLVFMAVLSGIPKLGIQELKSKNYKGEVCRVDGVQIHSIEREINPLEFTVQSSKEPELHLAVTTPRNPPDNFKVGHQVMVEGVYDPKADRFIAEKVQTACPSRYKASESAAVAGTADATPVEKVTRK